MSQKPNEITKQLKIIYRHRYLFVAISLLVMTAITAYSYGLPKRYQADSTVFIEKNIINRLVQGIAMTPDITDQIKVLNVALVSRDIITKVLKEIDSDIFTKSVSAQQGLITSLRQRIDIKVKGKELFTVSLVDNDPAFAQKFVNALVSIYVRDNISSNRDESSGANSFLVEQIELFKEKLERSENAIIEFRKKQG
ncbi:MAG TPA: chain-length determining protein, partial [Geopsychrobacteraceae bacterium]|nr:chain-length determining protein [Geopsychrobacteraceae bacterium]